MELRTGDIHKRSVAPKKIEIWAVTPTIVVYKAITKKGEFTNITHSMERKKFEKWLTI